LEEDETDVQCVVPAIQSVEELFQINDWHIRVDVKYETSKQLITKLHFR
jgi:hypothetical protein